MKKVSLNRLRIRTLLKGEKVPCIYKCLKTGKEREALIFEDLDFAKKSFVLDNKPKFGFSFTSLKFNDFDKKYEILVEE